MKNEHSNYGRKITFPFDVWPESHRREWKTAFPRTQFAMLMAPDRKKPPIADKYLGNILQTFERFRFFQINENPAAEASPLGQCLIRRDVEEFALELAMPCEGKDPADAVSAVTIVSYLERLSAAAARLDPRGHYIWLRRLAKKFRPLKSERDPPQLTTEVLQEIGEKAMADARKGLEQWQCRYGNRERQSRFLVLYRDGLMLAMLALLVLRIQNMLDLETGSTFLLPEPETPETPKRIYVVDLPASKPKMRKAIVIDVPTQLNEALDYYFAFIRPMFKGAKNSKFVWVGLEGAPLDYQGAYLAVTRLIRRTKNLHMNPNKARNAAVDDAFARGETKAQVALLMQHCDRETALCRYASKKLQSDIRPISRKYGL